METLFIKLNDHWNADPNSPCPRVELQGEDVVLSFAMNYLIYPQFGPDDIGKITFFDCFRYRLGATNDEGWYRGQCRFSKIAPAWGEFYKVSGNLLLEHCPDDWVMISVAPECVPHFLFYFRDEIFECDARDWKFEVFHSEIAKN